MTQAEAFALLAGAKPVFSPVRVRDPASVQETVELAKECVKCLDALARDWGALYAAVGGLRELNVWVERYESASPVAKVAYYRIVQEVVQAWRAVIIGILYCYYAPRVSVEGGVEDAFLAEIEQLKDG